MESTTTIFISIKQYGFLLSFLPAGRVPKKPKKQDSQRLQKAAINLLEEQQNLCSLLREVGVCAYVFSVLSVFKLSVLIRHYNPFTWIGSLFKNGIYYYILFLSLLFVESRSCQLFPLSKWKTETRQTWKQLKDYCRFTVGWVNENDLCKTQWCCSNDKSHDPLCTSRVTKPITVQMLHDDW